MIREIFLNEARMGTQRTLSLSDFSKRVSEDHHGYVGRLKETSNLSWDEKSAKKAARSGNIRHSLMIPCTHDAHIYQDSPEFPIHA